MSSASRPSEADVKPTRSANRTETSRRSATGAAVLSGPAMRGCPELSDAPHSPQNFAVGGFAVSHAGQASVSAVPHSPQNFLPTSFSALQALQRSVVTDAVWHVEDEGETRGAVRSTHE